VFIGKCLLYADRRTMGINNPKQKIKRCTTCLVRLTKKNRAGGHKKSCYQCKTCWNARMKIYYATHPKQYEKLKEVSRQNAYANFLRIKADPKRHAHKKAYDRRWMKNHRARANEYSRKYREGKKR
jgi:predicted sulfurtransferase